MNWETYLAFGDSITFGARTYLGYPELTGHILSKTLGNNWNIVNHSVNGYTAINLARDIDKHYSSLKEKYANITTILIGTNDVKQQTDVTSFSVVMEQIIFKAKLLTMKKNVVLIAIPEFPKGVAYPYSIEMNETIRSYNEVLKNLAEKHKIRFIELEYSRVDFFDGVHLNDNGVRHFADQVSKFILRDKGIDVNE